MGSMESVSVSVVGLGYIGLPTAAMFASTGARVFGVDINPDVVATISAGEIHIEETGLEDLVRQCVEHGTLSASVTPTSTDAYIIAVPTPFANDGRHTPDISYIQAAGRTIAPVLKPDSLIILESTSPIGTTQALADELARARPDLTFSHQHGDSAEVQLAYCPERIIPGRMLEELVHNDRIVGGMSSVAAQRAKELYGRFVKGTIYLTDSATAEMVKLVENAYRDVNIAFANELSVVSPALGVDVWEVIELANKHPRVSILKPGPGVGGHCIAVDPWFIVAAAPERAKIIRTAREVNDAKPEYVVQRVSELVEAAGGKVRVACFGLAYKPDVDDFRESPSMQIASRLSEIYPGQVYATDPYSDALTPTQLTNLRAPVVPMETALEAEIWVGLVSHMQYSGLKAQADGHSLVDACGMFS